MKTHYFCSGARKGNGMSDLETLDEELNPPKGRNIFAKHNKEIAELKWEYENVCKFATKYEEQVVELKLELAKLREALSMISCGIDPRTTKYRKEVKSVCSEAFKDLHSVCIFAQEVLK